VEASLKKLEGRFTQGTLGGIIRFYESIGSTNQLALELPRDEAVHGTVLVAREQSAGRGRQGRMWMSEADLGLYFTVVILDSNRRIKIPLLSLAAGVAVYEALSDICSGSLDLKWPNDVLLRNRKVCGILGEAISGKSGVERIALGISVNLGHDAEDFPVEFREKATSIRLSEGFIPEVASVLESILERLNKWYEVLAGEDGTIIARTFARYSSSAAGKRVHAIIGPGDSLTGTTAGINDDGSLQLRLESGAETAVHAGEVHLL
jgi:BirA family biotin operon repressor/biotin-[acetyl-CoA-carboxylase] ligase